MTLRGLRLKRSERIIDSIDPHKVVVETEGADVNSEETPQNYQDDLDTDEDVHDPVMDEASDDPTEELGIPPEELKDELDDLDVDDDTTLGNEDARENIEDADED